MPNNKLVTKRRVIPKIRITLCVPRNKRTTTRNNEPYTKGVIYCANAVYENINPIKTTTTKLKCCARVSKCEVSTLEYQMSRTIGSHNDDLHWPVIIKKSFTPCVRGSRGRDAKLQKGSLVRSRAHKGEISRVLTFEYLYACQMPKIDRN